jgi:Putative transposase
MTLPLTQFIGRYLRHVPAPGSRMVRSYGLYAPTAREALARCRAQVGQTPVEVPVGLDWQTAWRDRGGAPPERCPQCGHRLVCIGVILPCRIPPPREMRVEAVA